jgi:DNA-binding NtrC family response regulator
MRTKKILIIEDSEIDAEFIMDMLKHKWGINAEWKRVWSAETLKEALQQKDWDLVLSDYIMKGFSGEEALEIFKESGILVPFILVSGLATKDEICKLIDKGLDAYVPKCSLERLAELVKLDVDVAVNALNRISTHMNGVARYMNKQTNGG